MSAQLALDFESPGAQILTDLERDNYMSAQEALDYGLIDQILDDKLAFD